MRLQRIFGGLVLLTCLFLCGCSVLSGSQYPSFRYRMTVEVETPQGLRTGSSVVEVRSWTTGDNILGAPHIFGTAIKGQAVVVDLPGGQNLFALQNVGLIFQFTPYPTEDTMENREKEKGFMQWKTDWQRVQIDRVIANKALLTLPRFRDSIEAGAQPSSGYPTLVTFKDINDPQTISLVDPDNLSATFDPGIKLRRITVQITDDAVTTDINKRLPRAFWLKWGKINSAYYNENVGRAPPAVQPLTSKFSRDDFTSENIK